MEIWSYSVYEGALPTSLLLFMFNSGRSMKIAVNYVSVYPFKSEIVLWPNHLAKSVWKLMRKD
jgi:hypothetical protein